MPIDRKQHAGGSEETSGPLDRGDDPFLEAQRKGEVSHSQAVSDS